MCCEPCTNPSDQFATLMKKFGNSPIPTVPAAVMVKASRIAGRVCTGSGFYSGSWITVSARTGSAGLQARV